MGPLIWLVGIGAAVGSVLRFRRESDERVRYEDERVLAVQARREREARERGLTADEPERY